MLVAAAVASCMAGSLAAQESEAPDLSFLEYLGSWDDGDEEWLVVAELEEQDGGNELANETDETDEAEVADPIDETVETDER
jgi:hypothetical protein